MERLRLRRLDKKIDDLGADLRSEMHSLRADVASDIVTLEKRLGGDMATLEKRLGDQIVGLRRTVMEYHSSAIGHGVLIHEFDERLRFALIARARQ